MMGGGKRFDVVGFGFNTIDHVCVVARPPGLDGKHRVTKYFDQPGGQVPTALVALQRWGLRTAYAGPLGDDLGGRLQYASLAREGINLTGCRVRAGIRSQTSVILIEQVTGERSVLWDRPDDLVLPLRELDRELLTSGKVLFMDGDDIEASLRAAEWAKTAGCKVMIDIDVPHAGTPALLELTDIVVVSSEFTKRFGGGQSIERTLRWMLDFGPELAVVTLGRGGSIAASSEGIVHTPAFRVPVVDTTSAGDLFHAGLLHALLRGNALDGALRFATVAAALECTALGGRAAIPKLEDVEKLCGRVA